MFFLIILSRSGSSVVFQSVIPAVQVITGNVCVLMACS